MKTCPRCRKEKLRDKEIQNALSRRDNKTYICSDCGTAEALIDAGFTTIKNNPEGFLEEYSFLRRLFIKEGVKNESIRRND